MAGQNLLHQRGAGARHADNKNRLGVAAAGAPGVKYFLAEKLPHAGE